MINFQRNILKCPKCGVLISTESPARICIKCEIPMVFLGTDKDKAKFIYKPKDD